MKMPNVQNSLLLMVDMQEKLLPAMHDGENCINRNLLLLQGAAALELPVIISEQYPQGLGSTIPQLKEACREEWPVGSKTSFSCFGDEDLSDLIRNLNAETLIISGVESHVCVCQTALDAVNEGYQVIVASDAVTSRKPEDRCTALKLMAANGVQVMSAEAILFLLLGSAKHPAFKTISKLVR
jgi:nicotinamidase-related amidase